LVLALVVLATHTAVIGGYFFSGGAVTTAVNGTTFGEIAVFGFFGISGYLIAGSALRNGSGRYLWQRVLRILPGFWVCLLMTAFVFGVIGWLATPHPHCGLDCYVSAKTGPFDYLYNNWFLYINQNQIAGTPNGIPAYLIWNQSLWTLYYEFLCYLGLGLLALAGFLRHRIITFIATAGLWLTVTIITLTPTLNAQFNPFQNWTAMNLLKFATVFLVGSVIYLYRDQIPDSAWLALVCTALFAASLFLPTGGQVPDFQFTSSFLLAPLVAYPMLWLGAHLPFQKVGASDDYSYGVYIYAWPVSQILAIWGVMRWGYPIFTLLCVVATAPFAVGWELSNG
jgi:peptidoglycan/LPS O-acetylase OafA/YrhL